jgi:hypothetical protein
MRKWIVLGTAGLIVMALAVALAGVALAAGPFVARAQEGTDCPRWGQAEGEGFDCPRAGEELGFVDEDGNGMCDVCGEAPGEGGCSGEGTGRGYGGCRDGDGGPGSTAAGGCRLR